MQTKEFTIKTKIISQKGSLEFLKKFSDEKVFITADPFLVSSGLIRQITSYFKTEKCHVFSDIIPDPDIEVVVNGINKLKELKPQVFIAVGGGSAIDTSKAVMLFAKKMKLLKEVLFVAIPTTAGTGSEVTKFAVISNHKENVKYPIVSDELLPDIALLDSSLLMTLPQNVIADTGMDVLTHAIEAYVSNMAVSFTDAFAKNSVKLVFEYLPKAYKNSDEDALEKMLEASCMAGLAFNQASLGLNHAMAHNIGGNFHISHGRINAILLPYVIEYNVDAKKEYQNTNDVIKIKKRYDELAQVLGLDGSSVCQRVKRFISEIRKLQKELGIPAKITDCGIDKKEFASKYSEIADGTMKDVCLITNPKSVKKNDIEEILRKL